MFLAHLKVVKDFNKIKRFLKVLKVPLGALYFVHQMLKCFACACMNVFFFSLKKKKNKKN